MKDIITTNSKGQYHGYQEYFDSGKLGYRINIKNDNMIGYSENHRIKKTYFYIR